MVDPQKPLVSIVMAYYNRREQLEYTLQSISKTSYPNVEIILVDDGSDDNQQISSTPSRFPVDVIRVEKQFKTWTNPCIPYNIGFKRVSGSLVFIKNPECMHIGDVISDAVDRVNFENYVSYACYGIENEVADQQLRFHINEVANCSGQQYYDATRNLLDPLSLEVPDFTIKRPASWFNHKEYRPVGYHFLAAVKTRNLEELNGFDESFADGIGFDDDDLVRRAKKSLRMEILDHNSPFVVHQWHPSERINPSLQTIDKYHINEAIHKNKSQEGSTVNSSFTVSNRSSIPREMNFFWCGKGMSWLRYMSVYSFKKFNPDWIVNLYTSTADNVVYSGGEKHDTSDVDYIDKLRKMVNIIPWDLTNLVNPSLQFHSGYSAMGAAQKSDFFSWDLLSQNGGFYSDIDILYIKPIDSLYNELAKLGSDTVLCFDSSHFSIGLLASSRQNVLYRDLFNEACQTFCTKHYQSAGIAAINRTFGFRDPDIIRSANEQEVLAAVASRFPSLKVYNLLADIVYPFRNDYTKIFYQIAAVPDRTIGIHWFGGEPATRDMVSSLNEFNYMSFDNTLTPLLKGILS